MTPGNGKTLEDLTVLPWTNQKHKSHYANWIKLLPATANMKNWRQGNYYLTEITARGKKTWGQCRAQENTSKLRCEKLFLFASKGDILGVFNLFAIFNQLPKLDKCLKLNQKNLRLSIASLVKTTAFNIYWNKQPISLPWTAIYIFHSLQHFKHIFSVTTKIHTRVTQHQKHEKNRLFVDKDLRGAPSTVSVTVQQHTSMGPPFVF